MTGPQLDHREDIHAHNPHSPLPSHYPLSCQPTDLNEFNYSNQPSQRIFPLALVGPGPDLNPLPHPQPQHQFDTGAASTSNHGKRRRNLPGENHRRNAAYDVWAFVRPLASAEPPPEGQWPTPPSPHITSKPKTRWFGCVLCSEFGDKSGLKQWRTFQNKKESSPTSSFRRHLEDHHMPIWKQECARLNIPFIQRTKDSPPAPTSDGPSAEPFTREGLAERIAMFVSSSRQSAGIVESPSFRDLLAYIGETSGRHTEEDIPHRAEIENALRTLPSPSTSRMR